MTPFQQATARFLLGTTRPTWEMSLSGTKATHPRRRRGQGEREPAAAEPHSSSQHFSLSEVNIQPWPLAKTRGGHPKKPPRPKGFHAGGAPASSTRLGSCPKRVEHRAGAASAGAKLLSHAREKAPRNPPVLLGRVGSDRITARTAGTRPRSLGLAAANRPLETNPTASRLLPPPRTTSPTAPSRPSPQAAFRSAPFRSAPLRSAPLRPAPLRPALLRPAR